MNNSAHDHTVDYIVIHFFRQHFSVHDAGAGVFRRRLNKDDSRQITERSLRGYPGGFPQNPGAVCWLWLFLWLRSPRHGSFGKALGNYRLRCADYRWSQKCFGAFSRCHKDKISASTAVFRSHLYRQSANIFQRFLIGLFICHLLCLQRETRSLAHLKTRDCREDAALATLNTRAASE